MVPGSSWAQRTGSAQAWPPRKDCSLTKGSHILYPLPTLDPHPQPADPAPGLQGLEKVGTETPEAFPRSMKADLRGLAGEVSRKF